MVEVEGEDALRQLVATSEFDAEIHWPDLAWEMAEDAVEATEVEVTGVPVSKVVVGDAAVLPREAVANAWRVPVIVRARRQGIVDVAEVAR